MTIDEAPPTGIRKLLSPLSSRRVRRLLPGIIGGILGFLLAPILYNYFFTDVMIRASWPISLVGVILGAPLGWWFWKKLADWDIVKW